ncbi:MAG: ABC transporter ATP-binding protein [Spirochaetales bacterium]|jgi:ATP-binding cassette subfamily B multidrug efflux pump|nr:ABC transporter ATP-binding protein [Spirochaetales bacterium]
MWKIRRYYLPYLPAMLLAVALLFLQANTDLALPDYLSRIVNVGLQQGGFENPVPGEIRKTTFEHMQLLTDPEYTAEIRALYEKNDAGTIYTLSSEAENRLADNPGLTEEISKTLLLVNRLTGQKEGASSGFLGEMLGPLFPETDPFIFLQSMPESQRRAVITQIKNKLSESVNPAMLEQAAIQAVRQEYAAMGRDEGAIQNKYLLRIGGIMLILTLISAAATILVGFIGSKIAAGVARKLRGELFTTVESFSSAEFDTFSTASLITRSTNDITQIQMVTFMLIRMVFYAPILGIGGVIRAFGKAPSMAWIIGVAILVLLGLLSLVMALAMPKFKAIQKLLDRLNRVAREQLSGLMVVRAFNRQTFELSRFDEAHKDLTQTNLFVIRVMVIMMPGIMLIMNLLSLSVIWIGAQQVAASTIQVGDMMAFLQYAIQIVTSFLMLSMAFIFIPRASVSADRIAEVLNTKPSILDPKNPISLPKLSPGRIEFRNVSFRYPGAEDLALNEISFTAEPGQTTAIIGSTGSGKSSLVNLIPRFYDVESGEILLDGIAIKNLDQHNLRSKIGYVPQKTTLFSGTITENLRYGNQNASTQAVEQAAEIAQAMEFISTREARFEASISQSGSNVSGGQKQRLSIARALVPDYPVLIFDDSFSALDFRTDAALRRTLKERLGSRNLIIVAQRVSTIMHAEQILVLEAGKIIGRGTHDQLMSSCKAYREIVISQLGTEATA